MRLGENFAKNSSHLTPPHHTHHPHRSPPPSTTHLSTPTSPPSSSSTPIIFIHTNMRHHRRNHHRFVSKPDGLTAHKDLYASGHQAKRKALRSKPEWDENHHDRYTPSSCGRKGQRKALCTITKGQHKRKALCTIPKWAQGQAKSVMPHHQGATLAKSVTHHRRGAAHKTPPSCPCLKSRGDSKTHPHM